ncbi:MAG: hypothetical protein KIT19_12085 [Phycisphaeraceae bacterium]|nr:hypothetical protein [Phycisphaeraceae bacterium]
MTTTYPTNGTQTFNSQPFNGQPNYGQPFNGQPFNGQPFNGQPNYGQPFGGIQNSPCNTVPFNYGSFSPAAFAGSTIGTPFNGIHPSYPGPYGFTPFNGWNQFGQTPWFGWNTFNGGFGGYRGSFTPAWNIINGYQTPWNTPFTSQIPQGWFNTPFGQGFNGFEQNWYGSGTPFGFGSTTPFFSTPNCFGPTNYGYGSGGFGGTGTPFGYGFSTPYSTGFATPYGYNTPFNYGFGGFGFNPGYGFNSGFGFNTGFGFNPINGQFPANFVQPGTPISGGCSGIGLNREAA